MKTRYLKYTGIVVFLAAIFSCSKDDGPILDLNNYIAVDETASMNSKFLVKFFSDDSLFVGYNKVYFSIHDKITGQAYTQADILLRPVMDMGTSKHACPVENPGTEADQSGYFSGAILFSMPGSGNSWSLSAIIQSGGNIDSVFFSITKVVATNPAKKIVVIDSLKNGSVLTIKKYPVSLVEPAEWRVGNNKFEITIHNMASSWSFPSCTDFSVEITPEMPSMGHGSPNNVNPVHTENGHYVGTVNFTMTGPWRINMIFRKDGRIIGKNQYFDINF